VSHDDRGPDQGRGDEGTVLVLVLGFTAVLLLMVGVVVNVSAAALARRAVASAADGAAVAAAQSLDLSALYAGGLPDGRLPLDPVEAGVRVAAYGQQAVLTQPGLQLTVAVQGSTATVVAVREVRLPFSRLVGLQPLRVQATARARAPVLP
jgi:hypothetical protein